MSNYLDILLNEVVQALIINYTLQTPTDEQIAEVNKEYESICSEWDRART